MTILGPVSGEKDLGWLGDCLASAFSSHLLFSH